MLCPLSPLQLELHRRLIAEGVASSICKGPCGAELDNLLEDDTDRVAPRSSLSSNNLLMQLRKVCNHPYLVLESMKSIPDDLYFERLISTSGKISVLSQLLDELIPQGHKVKNSPSI